MRTWPAVDVRPAGDRDRLLTELDDFPITALEEDADGVRVFFSTADDRDAALAALPSRGYTARAVDVDDEDWARRSQESLTPITVGNITVTPPWVEAGLPLVEAGLKSRTTTGLTGSATSNPSPATIVIAPSMGFGTGHHATTRLCLAALQTLDLANRTLLDIGTGSGVLAIAASVLHASGSRGLDVDADAVQAARENLAFNGGIGNVTFEVADFRAARLESADVVVANLTGALLARSAERLSALVNAGGTLIVSGLLKEERDDVLDGFEGMPIQWEREEDGWLGIALKKI